VEQAVTQALGLGAISFDAVKMLLLARLENRPARLDLTFYPYLPAASVGTTDPRAYLTLITGAGLTHETQGISGMSETLEAQTTTIVTPQILLGNHLKALKLPTFAREYDKVAMEAAQDVPIIRATCYVFANLNASTGNAGTSSAASAWRAFHKPRVSTRSTSRHSLAQQSAGAGAGPLRMD